MLKTRILICIVYSMSYLFAIKEKTDYRINTVSDRFHPYQYEPATLGKMKAHSTIIHRTIRCATGLSGAPAE
jgi:hypothetical protein